MGVGRRMKKQGLPEPLDEAHFTNLKRKMGMSVSESRAESIRYAKKPKNNERRPMNGQRSSSDGKSAAGRSKGKLINGQPAKAELGGTRTTSVTIPLPTDDDSQEERREGNLEDEFGSLDDSDGEKGKGLADDFLDSGSEVYNSEDDHRRDAVFSEDEDEENPEETLTAANIAGLSRKLDEQKAAEEADAQAELEEAALQTNIAGDRPHILDSEEEDDQAPLKSNALLTVDLQLLRTRINDTVRVLDDFSTHAEPGRSRAEYTAQLLKDICAYYGYSSYLAEKLYNLFTPREAFAFFEANETPRPVVIRTNTLRTHRRELAQALINRGVTLEPVGKWSKVGLQIFESTVPLGATPEYLAGHYILQAASSFLPVMALAPQEHERILDMAAAPGGKTTYIAALMKNTGCIFANDSNKSRGKGLIGNIHRLGAKNTIVCNHDAREFPKIIGGFDRVLLDAPCSGTGVIAKDPSIKTNKTETDFLKLPHLQKQLLLAAIDSVDHASKTGGYIVYSTCSVTIEENEGVVQYALSRRPNVKLVEMGLPFGKEGFTAHMGKQFDKSLSLTRRFYPHAYNVDGFFVSKFKKIGPSPQKGTSDSRKEHDVAQVDKGFTDLMSDGKLNGEGEDVFGGWDDEEDEQYMERARRSQLRRKGLNPKARKGAQSRDGDSKS